MKKFTLLFLTLFAVWLTAGAATPAIVPEGQYAIFIKSSGVPNLYVWNGSDKLNGDWPGTALSEKCVGSSGTTYYYFVVPSGYTSVDCIINYNGNDDKTDDLSGISKNTYFVYEGSTSKGKKLTQQSVPSDITIQTSGTTSSTDKTLYLVGDEIGWNVSNNYAFTKSGNTYTLKLSSLNGNFKIKDDDPDWKGINLGGDGNNDPSITVVDAVIGNQTLWQGSSVNLNANNLTNVTLTLTYNTNADSATLNISADQSSGGDTTDKTVAAEIPQGQFAIFVKASQPPLLHVWDNGGNNLNGDYPGSIMQKTCVGKNGQLYYYYVVPSNNTPIGCIISFNGDKDKTNDIKDIYGNVYLEYNGQQGSTPTKNNIPSDITIKYVEASTGGNDNNGGRNDGARMSGISPTGTLPVLYINVYNNNDEINDDIIDYNLRHKDYFSNANYWLVDNANPKNNLGSEETPLPLEIKARGNYTRTGFAKKPFKLKLGSKQKMLGMTKSKHFALIAHADDDQGFLRNFTGFSVGKKIGLPWTPAQQPVEVVINGDYRGLYFLTESIRIGDDRIQITELGDEVSSPENITGGYLVELDNYATDPNTIVVVKDYLMITPDTPEKYSADQKKFVTEQFTKMNELVGNKKSELWSYLDLDDAARYYIVEELMGHYESYHGSTYLYRDQVASPDEDPGKWHFSPLWDFGHAFGAGENKSITDRDGIRDGGMSYGNTWINDMRDQKEFTDKVKATWQWFMSEGLFTELMNEIDAHTALIAEAAKNDHKRWPSNLQPGSYFVPEMGYTSNPSPVVDNSNITAKAASVKSYLRNRVNNFKGWSYFGNYEGNYPEPARDNTTSAPLPDYVFPPQPEKFVEHNIPCHWATPRVYVDNEANWSTLSVWLFKEDNTLFSAEWPGFDMQSTNDVATGTIAGPFSLDGYDFNRSLPYFEVPEGYENGYIVFSNNGSSQYPAQNNGGVAINGVSHLFNNKTNKWSALYPYSGTLPVLSINITDDAEQLNSFEQGKKATMNYTLDASYCSDDKVSNCNSATPDLDTIKVRGTTSYDENGNIVDQPSYKIQLDKKAAWCGMAESKHFVLMPWVSTKSNYGLLNNIVGHKLSRLIGLHWTPEEYPVELMINGEYKGLYFVVENVRPSENRVAIPDAGDTGIPFFDGTARDYNNATDWIIEIDNSLAEEDANYSWTENDMTYRIEATNPEKSDWTGKKVGMGEKKTEAEIQAIFDEAVKELIDGVNSSIVLNEKGMHTPDYEKVIDRDQAVKYYIIQEIMDDVNAYNKSLFLYHTSDAPWIFGPVWDFSYAFASNNGIIKSDKNSLIHGVDGNTATFIDKLYSNPYFRNVVIREYQLFVHNKKIDVDSSDNLGSGNKAAAQSYDQFDQTYAGKFDELDSYIDRQADRISKAYEKDAIAYPENAGASLSDAVTAVKAVLDGNIRYLDTVWNEATTTSVGSIFADSDNDANAPVEYFDTMGRRIAAPSAPGVYIRRQGSNVAKQVIR